jgi:pyruvate/2-oxoglutarate dehydrogenase complex dihydrolipoamide acyltransferase (E2) component
MKRRLGDRKDGYKLRKVDALFRVIPHIMATRNDAQVYFEDRIYLEETQKFIREMRKEGHRIGFLHIVVAAMIRVISQKPHINRFVVGKRIYARNEISFSLAVKKEMTEEGEETTIKVKFEPTDTIYDVIDRINKEIEANKVVENSNDTDAVAKFLAKLPNFMLGLAVWAIKWMDNHNILPKALIDASPFHSSMFITDVGSIGIKPIFHHIYNFGTNSIFLAFGTRSKEQVIDDDLSVNKRKAADVKFVVDERIVDGFYYASSIKMFKRLVTNPESLLTPPEEVFDDLQL